MAVAQPVHAIPQVVVVAAEPTLVFIAAQLLLQLQLVEEEVGVAAVPQHTSVVQEGLVVAPTGLSAAMLAVLVRSTTVVPAQMRGLPARH